MRRTAIALVVGLALTAVAIGVVVSRRPLTVIATNSVPAQPLGDTESAIDGCQPSASFPAGVSAIRVSLEANVGPSVRIRVLEGRRVLTEGGHPAGWGIDANVTVPVRPLAHAVSGVQICTSTGRPIEYLQVNGLPVAATAANGQRSVGVELRMEYLRPNRRSWLELAPSIARAMGLGRGFGGVWIVFLALALALVIVVLASRLALEEMS